MEYHNYYLTGLYPLQDKFLKFFNDHNEDRFYLTGGTALSRFYCHHRYSEDLDFFSSAELENFRDVVAKIFIIFGMIFIAIGGLIHLLGRIPGIVKLPGDIFIKKENFTFYFPFTTCIFISIIFSFILFLWNRK